MSYWDSPYSPEELAALLRQAANRLREVGAEYSSVVATVQETKYVTKTHHEPFGFLGLFSRDVQSQEAVTTRRDVELAGDGWLLRLFGGIDNTTESWGAREERIYVALVLNPRGELYEVGWTSEERWERGRSPETTTSVQARQPLPVPDTFNKFSRAFHLDFHPGRDRGHHQPGDSDEYIRRDYSRPCVAAKGDGLRHRVQEMLGGQRLFEGILERYLPEKGYGFIKCDLLGQVFLHRNQVPHEQHHLLVRGARIQFNAKPGEKGPAAQDVWAVG